MLYLIVFAIIIAFVTGDGSCLGGLIMLIIMVGISIAIITGAFAINPILGIIVVYFVIQVWRDMSNRF